MSHEIGIFMSTTERTSKSANCLRILRSYWRGDCVIKWRTRLRKPWDTKCYPW